MYQKITTFLLRFISQATLFKWGFNLSPMYRNTTAKIINVTDDLLEVGIKISINYRNRNFVGSIFGGSLFAATDPIFMIQLMWILGKDYVVWDKAATIKYKKPAYKDAFCNFKLTDKLIASIKKEVAENGEMNLNLTTNLQSSKGVVFCEVDKVLYIATKAHYKQKIASRK